MYNLAYGSSGAEEEDDDDDDGEKERKTEPDEWKQKGKCCWFHRRKEIININNL